VRNGVVLFWSGGKDSAMAFYEFMINQRYDKHEIKSLLTTFTEGYNRVSGHGVRRSVIEKQIDYIDIDLDFHPNYISKKSNWSEYVSVIENSLSAHKKNKLTIAASGDIFLEKQRMATIKKIGMKGSFPLMFKKTREQAIKSIDLGFKSYIVCVDSTVLDKTYVGKVYDRDFIEQLPRGVDPCGENGEFHTLVFDGPIFEKPLKLKRGSIVFRELFYFADFLIDE
jgi:uncharacterized protein (TIGR00290 family)